MAAAAWSWVENMLQLLHVTCGAQLDERLDEHRGLDGHVQAAGDVGPGQRLAATVFLPQGHQAGHFVFGQTDFLPTPIGQRHVGDFVRQLGLDLRHGANSYCGGEQGTRTPKRTMIRRQTGALTRRVAWCVRFL